MSGTPTASGSPVGSGTLSEGNPPSASAYTVTHATTSFYRGSVSSAIISSYSTPSSSSSLRPSSSALALPASLTPSVALSLFSYGSLGIASSSVLAIGGGLFFWVGLGVAFFLVMFLAWGCYKMKKQRDSAKTPSVYAKLMNEEKTTKSQKLLREKGGHAFGVTNPLRKKVFLNQ